MAAPTLAIPVTFKSWAVRSVADVTPSVVIPETSKSWAVRSVVDVIPKVEIPLIERPTPTILSATTEPPVNWP